MAVAAGLSFPEGLSGVPCRQTPYRRQRYIVYTRTRHGREDLCLPHGTPAAHREQSISDMHFSTGPGLHLLGRDLPHPAATQTRRGALVRGALGTPYPRLANSISTAWALRAGAGATWSYTQILAPGYQLIGHSEGCIYTCFQDYTHLLAGKLPANTGRTCQPDLH